MTLAAVHKGVFATLAAAFAGLIPPSRPGGPAGVPVYDHAPQDAAYPYVLLGEVSAVADDGLDDEMSRVLVPITIHSRYRGQKEALDLAALARLALHDVLFPIDAGAISQCRVSRGVVDRDGDGITRVATLTVDLILEH